MKHFNVIWWDFNKSEPEPFDIIPHLVNYYNEANVKPETVEEFTKFVEKEAMYHWWGKCQYEFIIQDWPETDRCSKWDIYQQVMLNINIITKILMECVNKYNSD